MDFPKDTQADLDAFYSKHKLGPDGSPTSAWKAEHLTTITPAYPLTLAFPPGTTVTKVTCHKKVAASLTRVFEQILEHFGTVENVRKARMHLFAGMFNFRKIRGSDRLSTHSWAISIDIDSAKNPQGEPHDESKGMMPKAVVKIFEAEGWKWGGRFGGKRVDCMHFQATR
jgi:hypothetical protein